MASLDLVVPLPLRAMAQVRGHLSSNGVALEHGVNSSSGLRASQGHAASPDVASLDVVSVCGARRPEVSRHVLQNASPVTGPNVLPHRRSP